MRTRDDVVFDVRTSAGHHQRRFEAYNVVKQFGSCHDQSRTSMPTPGIVQRRESFSVMSLYSLPTSGNHCRRRRAYDHTSSSASGAGGETGNNLYLPVAMVHSRPPKRYHTVTRLVCEVEIHGSGCREF